MTVTCNTCDKVFKNQSSLNRHIREVHNLQTSAIAHDKSVWNYKCMEPNCNTSYQQNKSLVNHLKESHNKNFEMEELIFKNITEFKSWKCAIEEKFKCNYIVASRSTNTKGIVTYYNCNRTRTGKPTCQVSKRSVKSQGSCKLSFGCTSQVKLIEEGNRLLVFWQKTHYGHLMDLQHLRISKQDRKIIATKLISGIPQTKIIDQVRDKIHEELKRIDLLTCKDIWNIKRSYNIDVKDEKRNDNDAISIYDLWLQECESKSSDENPALLYKRQCEMSNKLETKEIENIDSVTISQTSSEELSSSLQEKIESTFQTLQNSNLHNLDDSTILQMHTHLNELTRLVNLPDIEDATFCSTKKKRKHTDNLCKPNKKEATDIKHLLNDEPRLYILKNADNDHCYL